MKRQLFILLALLVSISVFAQDGNEAIVVRNGVSYAKTNLGTASVVAGEEKYSGDVVIETGFTIDNAHYTVNRIDAEAFKDCTDLISVSIPNTITEIGADAFLGCKIEKVYITSLQAWCGITFERKFSKYGGDYCFVEGEKTGPISWGSSSTTVRSNIYNSNPLSRGAHLYIDNHEITDLRIPQNIAEIKGGAFADAKYLTSVDIGDNVRVIGDFAFADNISLKSVTIGRNVETIGQGAFCRLVSTKSSAAPDAGATYDAKMNDSIKEVHIHDIASWLNINFELGSNPLSSKTVLYMNGKKMKNVVIPNGTNKIKANVFPDFILSSVLLPSSLTSIEDVAFTSKELKYVIVERNEPLPITSSMFSNRQNAVLYVPKGSKAAYEAANYWKDFKEIKELSKENQQETIAFADAKVKDICMEEWDFNGDGELSKWETAMVTSLNRVFEKNKEITSFDELRYFTGLTSITEFEFYECSNLTSVAIPGGVTSIGELAFRECSSLASITICEGVTAIGYKQFIELANLISVTIPNSVTSIGAFAFEGCSSLASVSIPNNVTSIGQYAFAYCSSLVSVTIPGSVTKIGIYLFKDCTSLSSVTFCNGVTSTGSDNTFSGCTSLTTVNLPNSLTSIGNQTFSGCTGLTSIIIPGSVTTIKHGAFYGCTGLTSITIPNSVTTIEGYVFAKCTSLTSIIIPNSVTSIGSRVFWGCSNLTSVEFGDGVTSIGGDIFEDCTALTSIVIGDGVTAIGKEAFKGFTSLTSVTLGNGITSIGQSAFEGCKNLTSITIPSRATSIGYKAFNGCTGLTSITIPNSVTSINGYAFYDCSNLESVIIGNSVTSIGDGAFQNCRKLTSVIIPNSVTSIGDYAFQSCGLTLVKVDKNNPITITAGVFSSREIAILSVPRGSKAAYKAANYWKEFMEIYEFDEQDCIEFADVKVKAICIQNWDTDHDGELSKTEAAAVTSIGTVFQENKSITSFDELQYFTGLTAIDGMAFYNCSGLTSVVIPSGVTSIDEYAFSDCFGLTSLTIPSNVTSIGYSAFSYCTGLTSVRIPSSVTSIDEVAFYGCGLTSVTIPSSVTSIGERAFVCSSLTSIIVEEGNTVYDSRNNCNAIIKTSDNTLIAGCKNTIIPPSMTSIGDCAFYLCEGLTSLSIPSSVTSIGNHAFHNCSSLTSLTIPSSVTSIGRQAFEYCSGLTSLTVGWDVPLSIDTYVFYGFNYNNVILYVPKGTKAAYQAAAVWQDFRAIEEIGGTATDIIQFADAKVKAICVANWDTDHDGELSKQEAVAVTSIGTVFSEEWEITSFDELQYFTGLTAIDDNAFAGCDGLTSITLPNTVTSLGAYAFSGCDGLTSFVIPSSVTTLNDAVFNYCVGLTSIIIPKSVTRMGFNPLNGCSALTSIQVESGNPNFDSRNGCNAIIYGKSGILVSGCKNTVIPDGIKTIWQYAFGGCEELTSITIPASVTTFGDYAFFGCDNLEEIHSEIVQPSAINATVFGNTDIFTTATLYVPAGTKAQYQATDGWKNFRNIVEQGGTATDIASATITIENTSYPYTGSAIEPAVSVVYSGTTLVKGTDYSLSYKNNIMAGTATVTATGSGNYTGTVTATFTIDKAQLVVTAQSIMREYGEENPGFTCKISGFMNEDTVLDLTKLPVITTTASTMSPVGTYDITVSGGEARNYSFNYEAGTLTIVPKGIATATLTVADSCAYTGQSIKPDVTVQLDGRVLTEGTDYSLTFTNNFMPGIASLTIMGVGNYTGTVTKTFVIFAPTAIGDVDADATKFDVYDMSGRKIRRHVTNIEGLPKGVYIIGGRKRAVK